MRAVGGRAIAAGAESRRKPLYLGGAGASVDARDDALIVRLRRRDSVALVPIARVDRIVCTGRTDWSGRALELCLRSAVPVVLLDNRGKAAGWMEHASMAMAAADNAVEQFVGLRGWREQYDNWLRSRRMAIYCAAADEQTSAASLGALKRGFVYRAEMPASAFDFAHGWMNALALSHLGRLGLHGRYVGYGDGVLDLVGDVAWLLAAELALAVGNIAGGADAEAAMLRLFEAQRDRLACAAENHLMMFVHFVRRQARQWH